MRWSTPLQPNGILKPYVATCSEVKHGGDSKNATTKDNRTTTIRVGYLLPYTEYQCYLVASTIPARGQAQTECESRFELVSLIRTMPSGELTH